MKRIRGELKRDGVRLLRKAYRKLVVGESVYEGGDETILSMAKKAKLPGRDVYDLCEQLGVQTVTVKDHNDKVSCDAIRAAEPDLIVFTGGGLIRKELLGLPRLGVLNCHMGPLPAYRGMDVVEWPLLEHPRDKARLGITVHYMDKGVDTGAILTEQEIPFTDLQNFRAIRDRMEPRMVDQMVKTVFGLRDGTIESRPQQVSDGKQYFVLHPRLYEIAEGRLK